MSQIKLITLNVEMNRHWNDIIPFLERQSPDVLCLQEVFAHDVKMLEKRFGYHSIYLPSCKRWYGEDVASPLEDQGIAILTKLPITNENNAYYHKPSPKLEQFSNKTLEDKRATIRQGVVWGTVTKDGIEFNIATTHFTWTPDGKPNKYQDSDIKELSKLLDGVPDLVICGDFNTPRGENHIYNLLVKRFTDNVPQNIKTTLDTNKHRACKDPVESKRLATYVVDYIFSTPKYMVRDVRCEFGVSDHAAVIGTVSLGGGKIT